MSKFIRLYEALCPDDPIMRDDPRRPDIIAEMRHVCTAKTEAEAVKAVEWWNSWPNQEFATSLDFVRKAREMWSNAELSGKESRREDG